MNFDRMRALLLEQAVQGKLVPQLEDEPAVEQIGEAPEDVPFAIPAKWKWCKLESVFEMKAGKFISASEIKETGDYPCYGGNGLRGYVDRFNREGNFPLIGRQGALCGNINTASGKFYATEHAVVVDTKRQDCACMALFLKSLNLNQYATATAQPGLSVKKIGTVCIPIPPLSEQRRIVAKLEESFTEINRAEKAYRELQTLTAVLRKKIIQEAVMGKLVPQLDGEPAVEQIGDAPEDVPFEIPEKWKWLTFNEVLSFENGDRGTNYPAKSTLTKDSSSGKPFISAVNLQNLHISNDNLLYLSKEQQRKLRSGHVKAGDCLFCIRGSLGKFAFADKDGGAIASSLVILRPKPCNCIMQKYLSYVLLSPYFTAYMNDRRNGTAQPNLGAKELKTFPIPIPPIEEQGRIVAKTEELMKQVERLVS